MEPVFERLALAAIVVDKGFNCRQEIDDEELDLLGQSLKADGQDEAITVNWCEADEQYHLIDGERRFRALVKAKVEHAECKVYRDLDALEALKKHLRSDVHKKKLSPMDQAIGMQRLIEMGETIKSTAKFFGCGDDMVRRRLDLLDLPAEVQRMIVRKQCPLPIRHAEYLTALNDSDALRIARQAAPSTGPVVAEEQVKAWVDDVIKGPEFEDMKHQPTSRKDRRRRAQKKIAPPSRDQSSCPAGGGGGETPPESMKQNFRKAIAEATPEVACNIGIVGKLAMTENGLVVNGAMVTVRMDEGVHLVKVAEFAVDLREGKDVKAVIDLMKKHQPKKPEPRKKTATKKSKRK
jgi:ParB/RepB/Spo0J family partition protein